MKEELTEAGVTGSSAVKPKPGPLRVLLIEDNPGDAKLIEVMLAEAGGNLFELERVDRLSAGVEKAATGAIELVLLDLSLPDSQGLDTFARLHAAAPQLPIIVLSGLNDETVAVKAVHEGAQDYLVKGQVDGGLLVRAMRYAMERKHTADQLATYADELREKNSEMEADFNMAREIQQVFLPQHYPTFPQSAPENESALRFHHFYLPAAAVGGDFFNVFPLTDASAGIFICDVMGHGMRSALVTAIMRGLVEELTPVATDPGQFLREINRSLHAILQRTAEPMLATAAYVIVDVMAGELRFSSAGHPSPLRLERDRGVAQTLRACDARHGPALGLFEESMYPDCRCPLAVNDVVLLYTDGIYEVEGANQEEYGQERLLAAVQRRIQMPPPKLFEELLADARAFSKSHEFADDVCLLAVEVARLLSDVAGRPNR